MKQAANEALYQAANYNSLTSIKWLCQRYLNLVRLAEFGDQYALTVVMDIRTCLGMYGGKTLLSDKQIDAIKLNLIYGIPQTEVAEMLGVSQHTICYRITGGIHNMRKMLEGRSKNGG